MDLTVEGGASAAAQSQNREIGSWLKVTHLFSLVAGAEVVAAGTSPEPLTPLHQGPSQGVQTDCFCQELVMASTSCTSEGTVGAFPWLNVFFL